MENLGSKVGSFVDADRGMVAFETEEGELGDEFRELVNKQQQEEGADQVENVELKVVPPEADRGMLEAGELGDEFRELVNKQDGGEVESIGLKTSLEADYGMVDFETETRALDDRSRE